MLADEGGQLLEEARFRESAEKFEEAYALAPKAEFLWGRGRALYQLWRCDLKPRRIQQVREETLATLGLYMKKAPESSPNRAAAASRISDLEGGSRAPLECRPDQVNWPTAVARESDQPEERQASMPSNEQRASGTDNIEQEGVGRAPYVLAAIGAGALVGSLAIYLEARGRSCGTDYDCASESYAVLALDVIGVAGLVAGIALGVTRSRSSASRVALGFTPGPSGLAFTGRWNF